MTSLVDVIFLLLLFFMLTSTFTKYSEVELAGAPGSSAGAEPQAPPLFMQLGPDTLRLNGAVVSLDTVADAIEARPATGSEATVLISLRDAVTSQRLADLLVALRAVPGLRVTVLGS